MDPSASNAKRKSRNKRKCNRVSNVVAGDSTHDRSRKRNRNAPLNGMVVAVSTLDVKGEAHVDVETSYQSVMEACRKMGATGTGQVHRRVTCLLCSKSAVRNLTQRVRKALKNGVPLVDIAWVHRCQSTGERLDQEPFRLDEFGKEMLKTRVTPDGQVKTMTTMNADISIEAGEELPEQGWSEAVELGCCCICHENGDDKCPWCTECHVNKSAVTSCLAEGTVAKKAKC